jgi:hypothetical protein
MEPKGVFQHTERHMGSCKHDDSARIFIDSMHDVHGSIAISVVPPDMRSYAMQQRVVLAVVVGYRANASGLFNNDDLRVDVHNAQLGAAERARGVSY